jgi:hypothetical protein
MSPRRRANLTGTHSSAALWLALSQALCAACESGSAPGGRDEHAPPAKAGGRSPKYQLSKRPQFVRGPTDGRPIPPFVAAQLRQAAAGERILVYVGAEWCEPCRRFHDAAESGRLDGEFPGLTLVEFDLDADRDALEAAGYASRLIPLFAVPTSDGRGSAKRISGSIKGELAVRENLLPRLHELLD